VFDAATHFDLTPHCSLSVRGAVLFFGSVCLATFGVAGVATAMGYWPVLPFAGAEMARATGGEWFDAATDLAGPLAKHVADLRASYVLTFTPKGVKRGDGWHTVTVRLKGAKGKVVARPGYYAGGVVKK